MPSNPKLDKEKEKNILLLYFQILKLFYKTVSYNFMLILQYFTFEIFGVQIMLGFVSWSHPSSSISLHDATWSPADLHWVHQIKYQLPAPGPHHIYILSPQNRARKLGESIMRQHLATFAGISIVYILHKKQETWPKRIIRSSKPYLYLYMRNAKKLGLLSL